MFKTRHRCTISTSLKYRQFNALPRSLHLLLVTSKDTENALQLRKNNVLSSVLTLLRLLQLHHLILRVGV